MASNTAPNFTKQAQVKWITVALANNDPDLTGETNVYDTGFVGGAEGSYVDEVVAKVNPAEDTVATVLRVWLNDGGVITDEANSTLIGEVGIGITAADAESALPAWPLKIGKRIPSGYKIYVTLGTAVGGTAKVSVTVWGGDF